MKKNLTSDSDNSGEFTGYCEWCRKVTIHKITNSKPGHEETGLLGTDKIECQECGTSFWV